MKHYKWYYSLILALPVMALVCAVAYRYCIYSQLDPLVAMGSDYKGHLQIAQYIRQGDFSPVGKQFPHIFSYPLFHLTTALLSFATGSLNWACFLIMVLSILVTIVGVRKLALRQFEAPTDKQRYLIDFFSVTSVVLASISGFVTAGSNYLPYGSFNVWHNPTIIFMRPFAIYATYYFLEFFRQLPWSGDTPAGDRRPLFKNGALFAALLFLSVLAKPNFALVFLIAAGLLTAIRFFAKIRSGPRQAFVSALILLLCVLPSIVLMLWQMNFCNTYSETVSFGLQLRSLGNIFRGSTLRGIVALYMMPLLFLAFGYKHIKGEPMCQLALIMLAVSTFVWYCTVQGMELMTDYAWSYIYSLYFMAVTAAVFSVKYIRSRGYQICFSALWCLHLAFGLRYMWIIITTGQYL